MTISAKRLLTIGWILAVAAWTTPSSAAHQRASTAKTAVAAPACDFAAATGPVLERKFAVIPNKYLADTCIKVRNEKDTLLRVPLDTVDFVNACAVEIEKIAVTHTDAACTPKDIFATKDHMYIRDYNGEMTLTIRRPNISSIEVPLTPGTVAGVTGVPWMWGIHGTVKYFVYFENRPNLTEGGVNKIYRLEAFDTTDPKWNTCVTQLPEMTALAVKCDSIFSPNGEDQESDTEGQESDTGGGGEPPPKPR